MQQKKANKTYTRAYESKSLQIIKLQELNEIQIQSLYLWNSIIDTYQWYCCASSKRFFNFCVSRVVYSLVTCAHTDNLLLDSYLLISMLSRLYHMNA